MFVICGRAYVKNGDAIVRRCKYSMRRVASRCLSVDGGIRYTEHLHTSLNMQAGASMQIPGEKIAEDSLLCKKKKYKMLTLTVELCK